MNALRTAGLLLALAAAGAPQASRARLSAEEVELKVDVEVGAEQMVATLARWVEVNTGSWNGPGLERFAALLAAELEQLDFEVGIEPGVELDLPGRPGARTGPLVVGRRAARRGESPPRFLLIGHYDTVFEPGSGFESFERQADDPARARGPGVADMKGGIVVMLHALRGLRAHGVLDRASWTVMFNADEEIGSLGSRARIEEEAREADYGFVFEAAHPSGAMVESRRGLGQFHLRIDGVAAHAGSAHRNGRSAIRALAAKVLRVEALTDYERGVTLNVGTIEGGLKRNVVPARAEAWIDLRYDTPELGETLRAELQAIADEVDVDETRATLWGRLHRPPKVLTSGTRELLDRHAAVARDLQVELPAPVHAGGGTDGSLTSAVGLPTLDSVGVIGGGAHTPREFVDLRSLPQRAVLAAILLRRLALDARPGGR